MRGLLAWVALLTLAGCTPRAGDACEEGKAFCQDEKNELVCQKGKLLRAPCKGPKGCRVEGSQLTCDLSGNAAGDPCSTEDEGDTACTPDGKAKIACKGGAYVVTPCRGPKGCEASVCDISVVEAGDPCNTTGLLCSVDGKSALKCAAGKWVKERECAQPCKLVGGEAECEAPAKPSAP